MTSTAKYGYCITTTPGLIDDGSYPLSAAALRRGEIKRSNNDPAIWSTREAAEAAMRGLIPKGKSPSVYAGLSVQAAFDLCAVDIAYGFAEGMDGFSVPGL
jgi:hypothetical protein